MSDRPHLIIDAGPDAGRTISVTHPDGVRVGRATKNDVILHDAKASRFHCRLYLKPGEGLWISDLGSANKTLVNDKPVQEVRLHAGDRVAVGDSTFKVIDDAAGGARPPVDASKLDLGLGRRQRPHPPDATGMGGRRGLWLGLVSVIVLAVLAWLPHYLKHSHRAPGSETAAAEPAAAEPLEIVYEKVLADTTRIFRYHFHLMPPGHLTVTIDDTDTTYVREEGDVNPELIKELRSLVDRSGFIGLKPEYRGIQPDVYDQMDIAVTVGTRTQRTRVINREEPPEFSAVRERLENFAQVELGLWAVQYPPEKLIEMANAAYLDGKKLFDERDVKHSNLADAIRRFKDAEYYLKTVSPKPDFYPDVLGGLGDFAAELDRRYVDQNFLANRAVRSKEWEEAARQLRVLIEIIGDRSDPRYEEARRELLEVESRMHVQK